MLASMVSGRPGLPGPDRQRLCIGEQKEIKPQRPWNKCWPPWFRAGPVYPDRTSGHASMVSGRPGLPGPDRQRLLISPMKDSKMNINLI